MQMEKRKLYIIIGCAVLALAIIGAAIAITVTMLNGRTVKEDGLTQNSRISIENVRYENKTVYYTIVNKTNKDITVHVRPELQRKGENGWKMVSVPTTLPDGNITTDIPAGEVTVKGFSEYEGSFKIERWLSKDRTGDFRLVDKVGDFYIVGYFTI